MVKETWILPPKFLPSIQKNGYPKESFFPRNFYTDNAQSHLLLGLKDYVPHWEAITHVLRYKLLKFESTEHLLICLVETVKDVVGIVVS